MREHIKASFKKYPKLLKFAMENTSTEQELASGWSYYHQKP